MFCVEKRKYEVERLERESKHFFFFKRFVSPRAKRKEGRKDGRKEGRKDGRKGEKSV